MFVPNFKILDAVVPEKSLTEKNLQTHTQTDRHCYRKDNNSTSNGAIYAHLPFNHMDEVLMGILIALLKGEANQKRNVYKNF